MIKVFADGGAAPPPTPPLFYAMQAGDQENRKNCVKHVVVMAFFVCHTGSLFANDVFANGGGGAAPPPPQPPRLFLRHAGWFSRTQHP